MATLIPIATPQSLILSGGPITVVSNGNVPRSMKILGMWVILTFLPVTLATGTQYTSTGVKKLRVKVDGAKLADADTSFALNGMSYASQVKLARLGGITKGTLTQDAKVITAGTTYVLSSLAAIEAQGGNIQIEVDTNTLASLNSGAGTGATQYTVQLFALAICEPGQVYGRQGVLSKYIASQSKLTLTTDDDKVLTSFTAGHILLPGTEISSVYSSMSIGDTTFNIPQVQELEATTQAAEIQVGGTNSAAASAAFNQPTETLQTQLQYAMYIQPNTPAKSVTIAFTESETFAITAFGPVDG